MIIKKDFEIPFYYGHLCVLITDEENVNVKDHYDDLGEETIIEFGHSRKVNLLKEGESYRGYLVAFNTSHKYGKVSHGAIAHEAFHATVSIMEWIDSILIEASEEPYAYLLQWVVDKIYLVFSENNIPVHLDLCYGNS